LNEPGNYFCRVLYIKCMETYKSEAAEIFKRFMERRITEKECIAALDSAIVAALLSVPPESLQSLRDSAILDYQAFKDEVAERSGFKSREFTD
jgi:hypothetical protein